MFQMLFWVCKTLFSYLSVLLNWLTLSCIKCFISIVSRKKSISVTIKLIIEFIYLCFYHSFVYSGLNSGGWLNLK